jgi:hypothetical protein
MDINNFSNKKQNKFKNLNNNNYIQALIKMNIEMN